MDSMTKIQVDLILSQMSKMDVSQRREIFVEVGKAYCLMCGRQTDPNATLADREFCAGPHIHFE